MEPITIAVLILLATVVLFIFEPIPIVVTAIGASLYTEPADDKPKKVKASQSDIDRFTGWKG